jgi:predicted DNA binding CopG/RHH family protein
MGNIEKRDKRIGLRLSDAELQQLRARARAVYLSLSAWIRQRLLTS